MAGERLVPGRYNFGVRLRLKDLRKERNLTQQQLADRLSTTHSTIQRWEVSKRGIPIDRIPSLAEALGVHPGELFAPLPETHRNAAGASDTDLFAEFCKLPPEVQEGVRANIRAYLAAKRDREEADEASVRAQTAGSKPNNGQSFTETASSTSPNSVAIDTKTTRKTSGVGNTTPPRKKSAGSK